MSLSLQSTSNTFTTAVVEGDKAETIAPIVSGTAVTATGTSVTFTGIPTWAKRITVMFSGVSTNGTSSLQLQIGTSAGFQTTGYTASAYFGPTGNQLESSTTGFILSTAGINAATTTYRGSIVLVRHSGNLWISTGLLSTAVNGPVVLGSGGEVTLAGVLDRVRATTVNGTDAYDAGSINIMWE